MLRRTLLCLTLLTAAGAQAAASGFLMGLDYSEWGPFSLAGWPSIAVDNSGALYILISCPANYPSPYCLTKLSADGKTIIWQNNLGFAGPMAVDPSGDVYVAGWESFDVFVEKLSADGTSVVWKTQLLATNQAVGLNSGISLAVDSTGRVFLTCDAVIGGEVVRLNAGGAIDYIKRVPIVPDAIAVDPTGSDVVVAAGGGIARLAADGATWLDVTLPQPMMQSPLFLALAVAPNGDAVEYGRGPLGNWILQRIDPAGAVVFSRAFPETSVSTLDAALALDAAGNAYITGYSGAVLHAVINSLAPCGTAWLSVFAPDGSVLQTTYLPGAGPAGYDNQYTGYVAISPNSTVFVLASSDLSVAPTQTGPYPEFPFGAAEYGSAILYHLSPNASAQTAPLACIGNAANFKTGPVSPGEIVTLFGSGIGPQQGVQTEATPQTPYPTQAANVEVTFDGKPAPLLWVQDAQINLAVPWSVAGPATQVCVTNNNVKTNCLTWPVAVAAPGVFTVDGVHAAAVNQDGTENSAANPAPLNSIVSIFATGLGPINPSQADGSLIGFPLPVNALTVTLECPRNLITACPAQITYSAEYAGPAPFQIAGMSQINFSAGDLVIDDGEFPLFLAVGPPSGVIFSNAIQIYVASQ